MIPVYIAQTDLDAQLVQELLVTSGIAAHIFGPNVADPVETVATTPQIRVVVEDAEAEEARMLVQDWQTAPAPEDFEFDDGLLDSKAFDEIEELSFQAGDPNLPA